MMHWKTNRTALAAMLCFTLASIEITSVYAMPCSRVPPEEMVRWKPCSPSSRTLTSLMRQIVISG